LRQPVQRRKGKTEGIMKNVLLGMFVLAAAAFGAPAATGVTGKWTGTFSVAAASHGGPESPVAAVLVLQQNGANITGTTAAATGPQHAISNGKIDGNKVTLEVPQGNTTTKFDLVLAGDRMTGEVNMSGGQGPSGKATIDVTRAK
jgi:hypothetical protein